VRDADAALDGRERTGDRRIHVAVDDDPVGLEALQHRVEIDEDLAGLNGMGVRTDSQVHIRFRKSQFVEEPVAHRHVIVLAGVKQDLLQPSTRTPGMKHRGHLHEIGARANYVEELRHRGSRESGQAGKSVCRAG
jgi:hypothetical protein